jgi:hypothetical protein
MVRIDQAIQEYKHALKLSPNEESFKKKLRAVEEAAVPSDEVSDPLTL